MFGCVYFPQDNTMCVVKEAHKTVSCEKFQKGETCDVKFKAGPYKGTIILVGDKEAEVKKTMNRLLKEVLNECVGDPVPKLLAATETPSLEKPVKDKPVSGKKAQKEAQKGKSYDDMMAPGSTLLETWDLIQGTERSFRPSPRLLELMRGLSSPSIQREIQEMLRFFESKDEPQYTDMQPQQTPANTTDTSIYPHSHTSNYSDQFYPFQPLSNPPVQTSNFSNQFDLIPDIETPAIEQSFSIPPTFSAFNTQAYTTPKPKQSAVLTPQVEAAASVGQVMPEPEILDLPSSPRRSPRKLKDPGLVCSPDEQVTLMDGIKISRKVLRGACQKAAKNDKPGFTLMGKLLPGVFTTLELANSKGLGICQTKAGDTRPSLDPKRISACKEYVIGWAKSKGIPQPQEKHLHDAVAEQTSYARKKLKRSECFGQL